MNLFRREMKASRKSLLIWIVGIIAMVAGGMGKYAGMAESGDSMNELMADLPKTLQAVFGVADLDISTPIGYYGVLFLYLLLMAAVHASMLGANILSKEERDKTSEFLLAKPISRDRLLTAKLLAGLVHLIVFNAAMWASSVLVVGQYAAEGESVAAPIAELMLGMLLVQFVFLSAGFAVAGAGGRPKRAVAISAGVMLLTFLLSVAVEVSGSIDFLRFLSPFQYADAAEVIESGLGLGFVLTGVAIAALCLFAAFVGYRRRDIQV
ncbi:ABC transporter permease subunit [Paenibacillus arenilitoris]|uniref:ABC transporter permease subunit n=1 Tax=Paenibacillus arenilitoris TaxID=2772299 RepID=A0A927CHF6_9BACL|nr:ABC transporter permease subunit [Paenibacillus arenilitoris]MBD2868154.1 ABC transporter permease subunit [Paenibacillus arenilitoris]